jgi:hypothetical protein
LNSASASSTGMRHGLEKDRRPVEFGERGAASRGPEAVLDRNPRRDGRFEPHRRGLPAPNLFAGMHEVHSQREWVSLQDMAKGVETLVHSPKSGPSAVDRATSASGRLQGGAPVRNTAAPRLGRPRRGMPARDFPALAGSRAAAAGRFHQC